MTKIMDMSKLIDAAKKMGINEEELRALLPLMLEVQDEKTKSDLKTIKKAKGGDIAEQMEMFQDGGLKDEGGTKDPVSGNDVPPGATQEEVRDDIPAQLSEGEFVFPADVVRYIGLEKLMKLRQEAKMGLKVMEEMGQMGNADEATIPDDIPFSLIDIDMAEDDEEVEERAQGGVIKAANGFAGTTTTTNPVQKRQPNVAGTQTGIKQPYVAPTIPSATAAPIGGFRYKSPTDSTKRATYEGLFGGDELGLGPDEYRTFVNDAGVEIQIPFKNGEVFTGFTIPEGFAQKTEEARAPKVTTARTQTARVAGDSGGDDGDNEMSDLGGARTTIGGVDYAVQYNFDGTVSIQSIDNYRQTGQVSFQKTTPEVGQAIKDQTKGQVAQLGYMGKPQAKLSVELARKAGITIPGVDKVDQFIKKGKDATTKLNNIVKEEDIFGRQVGQRPETATFDSLTRQEQRDIQDALAKGKGVDLSKMQQLADLSDPVSDDRNERMSQMEDAFKATAPDRSDVVTASQTQQVDSGSDDPSGGFTDEGFSESGYGQSEGSLGGIGDFKQGGLAKRKTKVKKMKRGGLASR